MVNFLAGLGVMMWLVGLVLAVLITELYLTLTQSPLFPVTGLSLFTVLTPVILFSTGIILTLKVTLRKPIRFRQTMILTSLLQKTTLVGTILLLVLILPLPFFPGTPLIIGEFRSEIAREENLPGQMFVVLLLLYTPILNPILVGYQNLLFLKKKFSLLMIPLIIAVLVLPGLGFSKMLILLPQQRKILKQLFKTWEANK